MRKVCVRCKKEYEIRSPKESLFMIFDIEEGETVSLCPECESSMRKWIRDGEIDIVPFSVEFAATLSSIMPKSKAVNVNMTYAELSKICQMMLSKESEKK